MKLRKKCGFKALSAFVSKWTGSVEELVRLLHRRRIPHLSFSRVTSVEFCQYRYFLEHVKHRRLDPEPDYFVKGRIFHKAAAKFYGSANSHNAQNGDGVDGLIKGKINDYDRTHIRNALLLLAKHRFAGWQVVAVETPFVLHLKKGLPPCVGVIDLVLRKGRTFMVVDHKTGKKFNEPDEFQLAIYRKHVRRKYGARKCLGVYDEYRWVNNLDRVRKPAFQRTAVKMRPWAWKHALERLDSAHWEIQEIEETRDPSGRFECYGCSYSSICPKASFGFSGYSYY